MLTADIGKRFGPEGDRRSGLDTVRGGLTGGRRDHGHDHGCDANPSSVSDHLLKDGCSRDSGRCDIR